MPACRIVQELIYYAGRSVAYTTAARHGSRSRSRRHACMVRFLGATISIPRCKVAHAVVSSFQFPLALGGAGERRFPGTSPSRRAGETIGRPRQSRRSSCGRGSRLALLSARPSKLRLGATMLHEAYWWP